MEPKWTQLRKAKETKWITTLRITYPYSIDKKLSDDIKPTNNDIVGEIFFP